MMEAKLKWTGGIRYEGTSIFGLPIAIDGVPEAGGTKNGYKPTELLLYGVAGCTGIEIGVKGYYPDEYPKPFNRIEIHYIFTGKDIDKKKVEKAINLSEEKYCMVSQILKGTAEIITSYEINKG